MSRFVDCVNTQNGKWIYCANESKERCEDAYSKNCTMVTEDGEIEICPYYVGKYVREKLSKLEEQQEEDCHFCNGHMICYFGSGYKLVCDIKNSTAVMVNKNGEIIADLFEEFLFCPKCGRKLMEG